jgi:hypothetical protein
MWIPKSVEIRFKLIDCATNNVAERLSSGKQYELRAVGIKGKDLDLRYDLQAMTAEDFADQDTDRYRYRSDSPLAPVVRDGLGTLTQRFTPLAGWGVVRLAFVQEYDKEMKIEDKRRAVGFGTDAMYEVERETDA